MNVKTGNIPLLPDTRKWLNCPRCGSGSILHVIRDDTFRCKRCGAEFTADFDTETTSMVEK